MRPPDDCRIAFKPKSELHLLCETFNYLSERKIPAGSENKAFEWNFIDMHPIWATDGVIGCRQSPPPRLISWHLRLIATPRAEDIELQPGVPFACMIDSRVGGHIHPYTWWSWYMRIDAKRVQAERQTWHPLKGVKCSSTLKLGIFPPSPIPIHSHP